MSLTDAIGSHEYATETSAALWAEAVSTFGTRLDVLDRVDLSGITQESIDPAFVMQRRMERYPIIPGVHTVAFSTRLHMAGHGTTTAGATSATTLGTLLGNVIGTVAMAAASGTTANGAGTDANSITTAASGTITPGSVVFIGVAGDGAGEGQAYPVLTHTGTALELGMDTTTTVANGAVIYSAENIYPDCDADAAIANTRHRIMTSRQQADCHGCFPTGITYAMTLGQPPSVTINWAGSRFAPAAATQPTTASSDKFSPAPIAGGSFVMETFGAKTRTKYSIRSIAVNHNLDIIPLMGPGGVNNSQVIVGAIRGGNETMTVDLTVDATAASSTPALITLFEAQTALHFMWTLGNAATGKRVALYGRKAYIVTRPVQVAEGGVNRWRFTLNVCMDTAGTNDITRAPYLWALG